MSRSGCYDILLCVRVSGMCKHAGSVLWELLLVLFV